MDSEPDTPGPSINFISESDHPQAPELEADEEEFDELNSDLDEEDPGPSIERIPGESLLPSLRLESIIKVPPEGVTGKLALSKEGLFILSVATEEFIKRLGQGGHRQASVEQRNVVNYRDLAATTRQYQEFMFLQETIPTPVSLAEAIQLREAHAKEMLEDDPALATAATLSSTAGTAASTSKAKTKKSTANGKDKQYRNSSISRGTSQRDYDESSTSLGPGHTSQTSTSTRGGRDSGWTRWSNGQNSAADPELAVAPHRNGSSSSAHPATTGVNGHTPTLPRAGEAEAPATQHPSLRQPSVSSPWGSGLLDSSVSRPAESAAPSRPSNHAVNGSPARPPTSTASGFGEPPTAESASTTTRGSGGSSSTSLSLVAQNPGRTIYSQTKP
ncbi:hypothetical protein R3P38DRAFT_2868857 [Favolaschia claudopus]|uniref:Transcription factor CBF/NF-Y/archaeal histone domain-containing protein n=1 Tax=Favolaschia claudopus TaxID=2862362 RepID=A0AAW0DAS1_9AGAR